MGFLSNMYTKPGPGVGKDEPQKRRIVVFFENFFRHFGRLEQTNLVFLLFSLPTVVLMFALNFLMCKVVPNNGLLVNIVTFLPLSLLAVPLCGMTYLTRNFAREEHAFIWFDFIDQMKKNWKTALRHGLISYFVYFCGYYAVRFYVFQSAQHSKLLLVPGVIVGLILIAFTFAQYYIFPMMITFDIPYRGVVKNGFLFSIMAFLRNLLMTVLHVVVWGIILIYLSDVEHGGVIFGALLLLIGLPAFTSFLINFVTYPVLVRYIIKPVYGSEEEQKSAPREDDHYKPIEDDDKEKSEYVFENGRLVRRMDHVEQVFEDRK